MKKIFVSLLLIILSGVAMSQSNNDRVQIEQAILNYVDAFYQADTTKAYESVAKNLAKRGYFTTKEGKLVEATMNFEQLVRFAQQWKKGENITADAPKKITVFDIMDRTASAKVEAKWGIDYFHLAKINGKWMIMNVLWQEYPKSTN